MSHAETESYRNELFPDRSDKLAALIGHVAFGLITVGILIGVSSLDYDGTTDQTVEPVLHSTATE